MGTLKVIHISTAITWRGGEQQIVNLYEGLQDANLDVEQYIFCAKGSQIEKYCTEHNLQVRSANKRGGLNISFTRGLMNLIKTFKPDVLHFHDSHAQTAGVLAHKFLKLKIPLVLHRRVDFEISTSYLSAKKYHYPYIKRIICVSKAIEAIVRKSVQMPTEVIYSSNRMNRIKQYTRNNKLRNTFGIREDQTLIGNIAALADHKDYPTFIRVAKLASLKDDRLRFVIIGEGKLRQELEAMVFNEGLKDKIFFTGFRNDIPEIIHDLDIFLMTSKMEGLGSVILDVFAAQIPVVATNGGGIGEFVQSDQTGKLLEVGDIDGIAETILSLIDDQKEQDRLTQAANVFVQQHQYTEMAKATYKVYQEII